jgi:hypothetical protein
VRQNRAFDRGFALTARMLASSGIRDRSGARCEEALGDRTRLAAGRTGEAQLSGRYVVTGLPPGTEMRRLSRHM